MPRSREPLVFAATFVVLSAALGWLFWNATIPLGALGEFSISDGMMTAPAVSAMLAARGFSWKRKITYSAVALLVYPLVLILGEVTGFNAMVGAEITTGTAFPSLWADLYLAFLATFPLAVLVLFVGRNPALLWSRRPR
jgi:hypothetical protein